MKKIITILTASLVLAVFASAASAAVTFDAESGEGFVGKGDVQLAFGWNNAQLQSNASGLSFRYESTDEWAFDCYWETTTGQGKVIPHTASVTKSQGISGEVGYDARKRNQINGFILNGFDGEPTVVGGEIACSQPDATIVEGTLNLVGSDGGLYAKHGTVEHLLP